MNYQKTMSDEKLIRFYLNGDTNAIATLVELYKDRVYRYIYAILQNRHAAEEVFQEVFICLINEMIAGKAEEEGNFLKWATRIAQQLCIEYRKKNGHVVLINTPSDKIEPPLFTAVPSANYHESHGKIKGMIDMLPDTQREVMLLNHYAGLSFAEVAETMHCSLSMALDCMKLALNNLCKMMEEKEMVLN
ncbi:MAG: RNA polymerase sigma factor [Ferruginibacter sp.]|nr:RNA polymerase sigma factor [Ferruginibacter sp.]